MAKKGHGNWISIFGRIISSAQGVKYIPSEIQEGPSKGQLTICLAKSSYDFENGTVSCQVRLPDPASQVQIGFNRDVGVAGDLYAGIPPVGSSSYAISVFANGKWEHLAQAGFGERPPTDQDIDLEVRVNGSRIELHVNRILACTAYFRIQPCQVSLLLGGPKEMLVRSFAVHPQKPSAFVVMQFTDEFNALFNEVIRPTCEKYGLQCIRADDIYSDGLIMGDIVRSIQECSVIIADVTPDNPNVFYEVGYAHGMGKPTILLSDKKREKLPFDISGLRTLFYDNTIGGKPAIEERLAKHLQSITRR